MPDQGAADPGRLKDRGLQVLFALSLGWAIFWLGIWLLGEEFEVPNPVPEGNLLHDVFGEFIPPFVAVVLAGAITALVTRLQPGFFRFPKQVASSRVLVTLLLTAPVVALAVLVGVSAVCIVLEPPPWKSDNPQYIPAVFWYAPLWTAALTPVATVAAAWWWVVRRRKDRSGE